jgi:hypothetical protein
MIERRTWEPETQEVQEAVARVWDTLPVKPGTAVHKYLARGCVKSLAFRRRWFTLHRRRGLPTDLMRTVLDINVIVAGLVSEGLCHEVLESHLPGHTPTPSSILSDESIKTIPLHS